MPGAAKPTVLVIEDDDDARFFLEVFLLQEGFRVIKTDHGLDGLRMLNQESVDIVLLDLMLPDIDGFNCCSMMHAKLGDRCPPVIIITGLDDAASIERAFAVQATDYIPKPVNCSLLSHRIKRVLRERELYERLEVTNSKLIEVAQTDSLTQIANRHHLQNVLTQEWGRLAREQAPLALLMCDLDAFKQYNDSLGHLAGDDTLKKFASVLQASVNRTTDLVTRYGGEEFVVLLPNTDLDGLNVVDARIRQLLANECIPHHTSWVSPYVTYSAGGVVVTPNAAIRPDFLLNRADQALYQAKDQGRNCSILQVLTNLPLPAD